VISAQRFVTTSWASGIDLKTGRPHINPEARYDETGKAAIMQPGGQGAHGWHPMSFHPQTGLVYFSAVETNTVMKGTTTFKAQRMGANTGLQFPVPPGEVTSTLPREARSQLIAWDPVNQHEVWRTGVLGTIGGGTLATAGGLVFQGTNKGRFVAYRATDGQELWSMEAQTGVVAAASSFEIDGEQYVAVAAGYGVVRYGMSNQSRLLLFKLGGTAALPPAPPPPPPPVLNPPPSTASAATIEQGKAHFASHCAMCHEPPAANRSVFPDLRYSPMLNSAEAFSSIVLDGALQASGMASFKGRLTMDEVQTVRAYLIERANQAKAAVRP
jgi:quinohemoprotein ethanol dehydrogenase